VNKAVIVSILGLFLIGCPGSPDWNREKLNELKIGMTKEQVRKIIGQPREKGATDVREYWLYQTSSYRAYEGSGWEYLTPVVFEDGTVIGWGRNFWGDMPLIDWRGPNGRIID
jgi:hypothetical protein